MWLDRKADDAIVQKVRELDLDGVRFQSEYQRFYPNQNLASHVLGCVGVDNDGLEGLEFYFDEQLKGSVEDEPFQKTGKKRDGIFRYVEGKQLVLTIDKFIQNAVETELRKINKAARPESISAIVIAGREWRWFCTLSGKSRVAGGRS